MKIFKHSNEELNTRCHNLKDKLGLFIEMQYSRWFYNKGSFANIFRYHDSFARVPISARSRK